MVVQRFGMAGFCGEIFRSDGVLWNTIFRTIHKTEIRSGIAKFIGTDALLC